jgi:predicted ester cyclase
MDQAKKNKEFIIRYINALSGVTKTRESLEYHISDESLIGHILFFDAVFPKYEMFMDEITGEGNRVIVRARLKGTHEGEMNGIPPTHKGVLFPFVIGYEIENNKIISHWLIADQMMLMEQLGVMKQPA